MFAQLFFLTALIGVTFAAVPVEIRIPYLESGAFAQWSGRIVGGQTAQPHQFPYQVSLRSATNSHFCGASIVAENWVLTAAHCTINRSTANTISVVNAHHFSADGTPYATQRIVNHEGYDSSVLTNDIALVQTVQNILFSDTVQPIAISHDFIGAGVQVRVSGWGRLVYNGDLPQYLQYMDVVTLSNGDCRSRHPNLYYLVSEGTLCGYGGREGQGTCHGDSGGPIVANNQQVAAVSWGYQCARGRPDGFVRLSVFVPWIVNTMNS